jgi:hypothetical protein
MISRLLGTTNSPETFSRTEKKGWWEDIALLPQVFFRKQARESFPKISTHRKLVPNQLPISPISFEGYPADTNRDLKCVYYMNFPCTMNQTDQWANNNLDIYAGNISIGQHWCSNPQLEAKRMSIFYWYHPGFLHYYSITVLQGPVDGHSPKVISHRVRVQQYHGPPKRLLVGFRPILPYPSDSVSIQREICNAISRSDNTFPRLRGSTTRS